MAHGLLRWKLRAAGISVPPSTEPYPYKENENPIHRRLFDLETGEEFIRCIRASASLDNVGIVALLKLEDARDLRNRASGNKWCKICGHLCIGGIEQEAIPSS